MLLPDILTATPLLAGDSGTYQSLAAMRDAIDADRTSPLVRNAAVQAIAGAPERNFTSELTGLLDYVRERVRYTRDPLDVEYVQTPDFMLRQIRAGGTVAGDCDDSAVLFAALAEAVGYETRFLVLGASGENFSHVVVEVRDNAGRWVAVDPSQRGRGVGWRPTVGVSREGNEMLVKRNGKRLLGEDDLSFSSAPALWDQDPNAFIDPSVVMTSWLDSASPSAVAGSDQNAGGFFSGLTDFFGGISKTVAQLLPVAERYGVVRPVTGYTAAGAPIYASTVLPVSGTAAAYGALTSTGPLGLPWLAWLAIGGGGLLLLSSKKRGR